MVVVPIENPTTVSKIIFNPGDVNLITDEQTTTIMNLDLKVNDLVGNFLVSKQKIPHITVIKIKTEGATLIFENDSEN